MQWTPKKKLKYRKNVTQNKIHMKQSRMVEGRIWVLPHIEKEAISHQILSSGKWEKNTRLVSHKIFIKLTCLPKVVRTYAYKTISKLAESVCTHKLDGAWTCDKTNIFLSNVWKIHCSTTRKWRKRMEGIFFQFFYLIKIVQWTSTEFDSIFSHCTRTSSWMIKSKRVSVKFVWWYLRKWCHRGKFCINVLLIVFDAKVLRWQKLIFRTKLSRL